MLSDTINFQTNVRTNLKGGENMVYMITYDLCSPGQNYEKVIQAIESSSTGVWCTFWKSSYLIKSNLSANDISQKITPHLDQNDRLMIVECKASNYQGWLEKEDWNYINNHVFK